MGFPSEQCSCMISRAGKFLSCTSHASATPQGDCWCGVRAWKRNRHLHGKGLEPDSSHQRSDTISRQAGCSVPMGSQDNHSRNTPSPNQKCRANALVAQLAGSWARRGRRKTKRNFGPAHTTAPSIPVDMRATNLTSHIRDANSPSLEAFENVRYPFRHSFRGSWRIVLSTTCCNVTVLHLPPSSIL
ncbi:uncharacterized protein K489DRAFT_242930 [Dissoconium aciculare CBS 342.82]|uniref:Uncharacterized protein n=1 Tax=Dissoconium aciculare CBS 342.82 TaxID=1314786 RepID=A0A6J3M365_9PEZI|nr:uncharacterized protein K489DRAFT_242930 [Dissoconium aciculare CBS 342.82]KAF1822430.1 hypothetical protein K489DRAFT_242930 [Dissoconium aciculare CBS 342.82]